MAPAPKITAAPSYQALSTPTLSSGGPLDGVPPGDGEAPYVLSIAQTGHGGSHYAVSTSAPANAVHVLDATTLRVVRSLNGGAPLSIGSYAGGGRRGGGGNGRGGGVQAHEGGVSCLKAYATASGEGGLVSCGKEGGVVLWDLRTGGAGVKMYASGMGGKARPLLSCDISPDGWTVAAGSELQGEDAVLTYWDPRNPASALRTHTSTHSDDITVVSFAPASYTLPSSPSSPSSDDAEMASESQPTASSNKLLVLTGSTDGLLNISDANEGDEDEAVLLTANWGCSIAQAGWVGDKGVWAGSDMETFSTWSAELDPVYDFDVREPVVQMREKDWVTDYLIGAYASAPSEAGGAPQLRVFVGSNEGDASLIATHNPLRKPALSSPSKRKAPSSSSVARAAWNLHTSWTHAHVGVVRAVLYDARHGVVVTGGEDAKVNVWRDPTPAWDSLYGSLEDPDGDVDVDMDVDEDAGGRSGFGGGGGAGGRGERNSRKRGAESDGEGDDAMDGGKRRRR